MLCGVVCYCIALVDVEVCCVAVSRVVMCCVMLRYIALCCVVLLCGVVSYACVFFFYVC